MLDEIIKQALNKPIVITKEQLDNIQLFVRNTDDGIETISLEDYIILKVTDKMLTLMKGGE